MSIPLDLDIWTVCICDSAILDWISSISMQSENCLATAGESSYISRLKMSMDLLRVFNSN